MRSDSSALKRRFAVLAALMVVAAVVIQTIGVSVARNASNPLDPPAFEIPTILTMLAAFCTSVAAVLVGGIVALYVVDQVRGTTGDDGSAHADADDAGDEMPAYGSDPERL